MKPQLLARLELDASALWEAHPPRVRHANKKLLLEAAGGLARVPEGRLSVARWRPGRWQPLPEREPELVSVDAAFDYPPPERGVERWHVNFANAHLFCAYGASAFAQDEIQVAEHPVLASLLEHLIAREQGSAQPALAPLTSDSTGPTPITVHGAERWCSVDTAPELAMPYGIYGRRFDRARPEALRQAVTRVSERFTNIVAMEAPTGYGRYTPEQVGGILSTATTAFSAAREETARENPRVRVVVHTGHWGTGAYGGDRLLMAVAQLVAARFAGLDELAFHSLDGDGLEVVKSSSRTAARIATPGMSFEEVVLAISELGRSWGVGDGN